MNINFNCKQNTINYAKDFYNKYYYAMFGEIGFHSLRNGGHAIYISFLMGNQQLDNHTLDFMPIVKDLELASEFVNVFCDINPHFKNRGHISAYDFLPY